jgi:glycosyltransferase involved in cell wall biosynthesis
MGGAERVLLETIEVLKDRGVDCYVLLPGEGEFSQKLVNLGVPYDIVRNSSWITWQKPTIWRRTKATVKIAAGILSTLIKIKQSRCDIVYSNTLTICNGGVAAWILGIPHVWHLHEYHAIRFYYGRRLSFWVIGRLSAVCITVSKHLSEICAPYIDRTKLRMIYPSMHMAEIGVAVGNPVALEGERQRFRCVIVGGLFPAKRQEDAVQALGYLHKGGSDAELVIVGGGDPSYLKRLQQVAASCGVLDRVRFSGAVDDAIPFIHNSDVVLVCSEHEMFGRTTIEGMLAGKPVVAARATTAPELIQNGVNGWLYEPTNAQDLAIKIRLLCEDRATARSLGEHGQVWAQGLFTKERYALEMLDALTSAHQKTSRMEVVSVAQQR